MIVKIFTTFFLISLTQLSSAALVVDQDYATPASGQDGLVTEYNDPSMAQTFTVGVSGLLDSISLNLNRGLEGGGQLFTVSIYSVVDGKPNTSATPLFRENYSSDIVPIYECSYDGCIWDNTLTSFDLSGSAISVSEGDQLAFTAHQTMPAGTRDHPNVFIGFSHFKYTLGSEFYLWREKPILDESGKIIDIVLREEPIWMTRSSTSLIFSTTVSTVPVPAAVWLFGSALLGLFGLKRKQK